ncbi:MAG TPA: hypothetical protein VMC79_05805, partial [Rectinemataceae bacterium]|nr:hypothetical protein [Rectinemataceae bacterium]
LTGAWPLFLRNVLDRAAPREDDQSAWTIDAGEFAQRAVPQGFILHGEAAPEIRARGGLVTLFGSSAGFFPWSAGGEAGLLAVNVPAEELDTEPRALSVARASATPEPAGTEGRPDSVTLLGGPALGRILLLLAALCLGAEWILWRGLPRPLRRRPRRNHAAG